MGKKKKHGKNQHNNEENLNKLPDNEKLDSDDEVNDCDKENENIDIKKKGSNSKQKKEDKKFNDSAKTKEDIIKLLGKDFEKICNVVNSTTAQTITQDTTPEGCLTNLDAMQQVGSFLQTINGIRLELARLDTNLAGLVYYENELFPILNTLFFLAGIIGDLSLTARNLQQINTVKTSKLQDLIEINYEVDKLIERVFRLVEVKVYKLMRILGN